MSTRPSFRRIASLRLALVAVLLFSMQPLLHAHPMGFVPQEHRDGLHAPGRDIASAAVGEGRLVPDPVVVAEANRLDESLLPPSTVAVPAPGRGALPKAPGPATGIAPQPPPRATAPRGPPR
jgi:hypothetical protein